MSDNQDINQNSKSLMTFVASHDLKKESNKRSMLHNSATIKWLAKRYNHTTDKKYLFLPEQLQKEQDIQNIFQKIDQDGSGILSPLQSQ